MPATSSCHLHPYVRACGRQLRVGDITLYDGDKGGVAFFTNLKAQMDLVLARTFPVHFHFFAESPGSRTAQADYDKVRGDFHNAHACMQHCRGS